MSSHKVSVGALSRPGMRSHTVSVGALPRSRGPPCVLVLDVAPPSWALVGTELCEALSNTLCLSAAAAQPARLLSIYTVRERHQCVLPLLQVGGNFGRMQTCLSELRSLPREGSCSARGASLSLAVLDALQQNKQLTQHSSPGASLHSCSVEVTVVSSRLGRDLVSELDTGLRDADLGTLGRLVVLHIAHSNEHGPPGSDPSPETQGAAKDPSLCHIDFRVTSGDILSLENYFKSWLFETSPEREQVNLTLPDGNPPLCVMCDVQQRLVNPELLLGGHESRRAAPSRAPSSGGGPQTLRVLRAVSSQGVCGSVLYGLPSILTPTACWELDWEELETNQENFHALCHCLQTRELSLLACSTGRSLSPGWGPPVLSHFMVSASDSAALLLRPVAVRELILPADVSTRTLPPRDNALRRAEDALRSLDVDPVYNPLLVTCNLYRQLQGVLTRPPMLRPQWPQPQGPMSHVTALRGTQQRGSTGGGQSRQVLLRHSKARATVAPLPLCAPSLAPLLPGTPTSDKPARRVSFLCDKEEFLSDM